MNDSQLVVEQQKERIILQRTGSCQRCGNCCKMGIIRLHKNAIAGSDTEIIRDLFAWYSCREGIEILEDDISIEIHARYPCRFLSFDESGKATCLNYENRFLICRAFPSFPTKQCPGFKFVPLNLGEEHG